MQIYLRRILIRRIMYIQKDTWPIDQNTAMPPENWQGWPEGKKFALVLTHDVETVKGLEKYREVMKIEEDLGFRSSFNFVAGDYEVPMELINELKTRGFEVGIHGLHHNGNLYRSKKVFSEHARKIKQFAQKWDAVGFRTPSMYHNLEWIHDLNLEYDASTFDTDPFEPQPEAAGTIFPFWVESNNGENGYVELPYTLPQDFLLYILMKQKDIDIQKRKLDWIAENGGMALFITHPDYMNFNEGKRKKDEYQAEYYKEFLTHIKTKYEGQYWHVLPKQIASFWKENYAYTTKIIRPKINVCMLTYSFYAYDARVRRYAESLVQRGDHVDVLSITDESEKTHKVINGVHIYRIQSRKKDEKNKFVYLYRLLKFFINSSYYLTRKHLKNSYDLIHVHSVPDFEVFAAILPKLTDTKIILDIHDPVPDFFLAKFGNQNQLFYYVLSFIEKISTKFAHHVTTVTDFWMDKIAERSKIPKNKISVILNLPDVKMFNCSNINEPRKTNEYFTLLYPGTINKHCGLDIAVRAVHEVRKYIPKIKFEIYGTGPELSNIKLLVKDLGLENIVSFHGNVPLETLPSIMYNADIGIALLAGHSDYAQQALNVKLFEYLSMGLPAIATRTKSIEYYIEEGIVMLSDLNDPNDVARCIKELFLHPEKRKDLKEKGLAFISCNNSEIQMNNYLKIVDRLTAKKGP